MQLKRVILWLLICLPLLISLVMYPFLPDQLPMHADSFVDGTIRYGERYELLLLSAAIIAMGALLTLLEKRTSRNKEKSAQNAKVMYGVNVVFMSICSVITIWIIYSAMTGTHFLSENNMVFARIFAVFLSVCWIVIGNFLPKCKQNYLLGIRTWWTLKSETTWYRTHRFGAKVMVIFGSISALLCLFIFDGIMGLRFSFGGFLLVVILTVTYSYYAYRQEKHRAL